MDNTEEDMLCIWADSHNYESDKNKHLMNTKCTQQKRVSGWVKKQLCYKYTKITAWFTSIYKRGILAWLNLQGKSSWD